MDGLQKFKDFIKYNDIELSPLLRIRHDDENDQGYYVELDGNAMTDQEFIAEGTLLARIPKASVLSTSSAGISNLIPDEMHGTLCGLVVAYMFERASGERSPWSGYIATVPAVELGCMRFWTAEQQQVVAGTDAADVLRAAEAELQDMYEQQAAPLLERHGQVMSTAAGAEIDYGFEAFCRAASVVGARCFEVDAHIGLGMCPVADTFNHSDDPDVRFETTFEVCEWCGAVNGCEHEGFTYSDDEGENEEEEDDDDDDEPVDTCDIVAHRAIPRPLFGTRQVFNSYGPLTTAELVVKYGFALATNRHDYVSLEREARRWFRDQGFAWPKRQHHDDDDDDDYNDDDEIDVPRVDHDGRVRGVARLLEPVVGRAAAAQISIELVRQRLQRLQRPGNPSGHELQFAAGLEPAGPTRTGLQVVAGALLGLGRVSLSAGKSKSG
ncbi:hypothetical protein V1514DRAFT_323620 [Lipomyces japonicus]|uniref:uncharacterized protein n=1 Tax=Lipomyces japonicus TaxID=56871 RepID=UPI0034CD8470